MVQWNEIINTISVVNTMATIHPRSPHQWRKSTRAHQHQWPRIIRPYSRLACTRDPTSPPGTITYRDLLWQHVRSFVESKMISLASIAAGTLVRMLIICIHACKSSSITPLCVEGKDNEMADLVSRAFKEGKYFFAFNNIITYFNLHFPLPHNESWRECHIPTKWVLQVIACMRGNKLQLAWLQRLPKIAKNTGIIGVTTPISAESILSSPTSIAPSNMMSLLHHSLLVAGQACPAKILQSKFKDSWALSCLSPRPSNWLENQFPFTGKKANTSWSSSVWWKDANDLTLYMFLSSWYLSQFHRTASRQHYSPLMLSYVPLTA